MDGRRRWRIVARMVRRLGKAYHSPRKRHSDARVVLVWLWAGAKHQPVCWACRRENWPAHERGWEKPSPATMSRRLRSLPVLLLLTALELALRALLPAAGPVKAVDAKPLPVGPCSKDKDARRGWAGSGKAKGYKLFAITSGDALEAWTIGPMNQGEPDTAAALLERVEGWGYLLGDAGYDSNALYEAAARRGHQLLAPRKKPGTAPGHPPQSPHRLRAIELLEGDADEFGRQVYKQRGEVERCFAHMGCIAEGLQPLPSFVRRPRRVALWVQAKIVLHYAHGIDLHHIRLQTGAAA